MSAGWMRGWVCSVALGLVGAGSALAKPLALLVGVGQYPSLSANFQLDGPPHDVAALRDVLVRRWGFRAGDIKTLVNQEATRERIIAELQALQTRSAPGDEVLIYLSGHGTSGLDSGMQQSLNLNLPVGTGAFVPQDFKFPEPTDPAASAKAADRLIVGRRDLRPALEALDRGNRKVWVVADACYSGTLVRSARATQPVSGLRARWLPWPYVVQTKEDQAQKQGMLGDMALAAGAAGASGPYPYRSVAYLSSAAQGEKAADIPAGALESFPTVDHKPHGAMTDALLRVLDGKVPGDLDGNGVLDLNEVHRSVSEFMDSRSYNQIPQRLPAVAQDVQGLGHTAVLSARNVATKPVGVRVEVPALRLRLPEAAGALPAVLKGLSGVTLVGKTDAADVLLERQGAEWLVTAQGGDVIGSWPHDSTESVVGQVRQLAWVHRLRQLAVLNRKAALPLEVDPADSGGRFFVGQKLRFVARPEHQATLLLLNADSQGRVSVLFPVSATEASVLPKGQARFIPGEDEASKIDVTAPEGMDVQLAFAFESAPTELSRLFKVENVNPDDSRLALLERWLGEQKGKFSFASSSLHVVARPAQ